MEGLILAINPGSTSTKTAIFSGAQNIKQKNLNHSTEELSKFQKITDQYEYRKNAILNWLKEDNINLNDLVSVVGRGGLLRPMPSGTYTITDAMIKDLRTGYQGEHASNLGGIIAKAIGDENNIPSFIVDPVAVDELDEIARISGLPEIQRKSLVHALNIRAVSRKVAKNMNKNLDEVNFITAHLGGGISVAPIQRGKIIDVNNCNEAGPLTPERAGGVPVMELLKLAYSGKYTYEEIKKKMLGQGGLVGYLGTNDIKNVQERILNGDKKAKLIFNAMCYQIGKEIGSCAAVLHGNVDKIILTGGAAHSKMLSDYITEMVKFIAEVEVVPGEDEMQALAEGANRVIKGEEKAKIYEEQVKID